MRLGQTRTPSLTELLQAAVYQGLYDTHTALPGKIESYNQETQKANIKPLIKRNVIHHDGSEQLEVLPVIPDVPVLFPRANGFFISFPVKPGDFVLLLFCERSIDNWMAGQGEDTDPIDLRMHDLSDAVALPGFYPTSKAIHDHEADDLVIGQDNGGAQIAVKEGGIVQVTFDGGNMVQFEDKEAAAKLTLGDGAKHVAIVEALQTLWTSMKSTLDLWGGAAGHVHSTGVGPSGPPSPALSVDAWSSSINSTKVSIPDG